jgi:Putative peptidoglycan binding domain
MSDELKPLVGSVAPTPEPVEPAVEEVVIEAAPEPEAEPEVVEAVVPKPLPIKVSVPVAVNIDAVKDALPQPAGPAVVGNGEVDEVFLSACVYRNINSQKSLTVYHLQRRLAELGFVEAELDKQGFFGGPTKLAVKNFQASKKFDVTGVVDAVTFKAIFKGDPNVKVVL